MSRNSERLEKCSELRMLLRQYCGLAGCFVIEGLTFTECKMPSGAFLKIFNRPLVNYGRTYYGFVDLPRRNRFHRSYFDDHGADNLCMKLKENIITLSKEKDHGTN